MRLGLKAEEVSAEAANQIGFLMQRILGRNPSAAELNILRDQLATHLAEFSNAPDSATELLRIGQTVPETRQPQVAAALAMIASTLLNLDEAITHE